MTEQYERLDEELEYDPHLTESVEVKKGVWADIDCGIVPLIRWLNSYGSITTHFCCEGEDDGESTGRPYVLLTCTSLSDLEHIALLLNSTLLNSTAEGELSTRLGGLRFTFRFWSKDHLRQTLLWLAEVEQAPPTTAA